MPPLHMAFLAYPEESDYPCLRDGGGLLEGQTGGFQHHGLSMCADVLRETATVSRDLAKDFIARFELGMVYPGKLHSTGDVRSQDLVTWLSDPSQASVQRFTDQTFPV